MTRGARGWFEAFLVGIIVNNPKLADGQAVFSAAHANSVFYASGRRATHPSPKASWEFNCRRT